jgi:hypothetical protein
MAAYNKFNAFVANAPNGVMNLGGDTLKVALSDVAPVATNTVFANITEIAGGNGYTAGGTQTVQVSSSQTAGTYKLISGNVTFTASGGAIAQFRYVVLYDSTPTSPLKPLISWYDYGSEVNLNSGDSFTVAFDATNGVLQLA